MRRVLSILLIFLLLALSMAVRTPAAYDLGIIEASSAKSASATGTTTVPVMNCDRLSVTVSVTAGAATITQFQVFMRGSSDNVTYQALPAQWAIKDTNLLGSASPAPYLVNETALVNAATVYTGIYELAVDFVKPAWIIVGGGSETFSVRASCK